MLDLVALVRNDSNTGWLRFSNPERIVLAQSTSDVLPALEEIDAACSAGLTAIGFVAYEAAPAFDVSLQCSSGKLPLLLFGLYNSGVAHTLKQQEKLKMELRPQMAKSDYVEKVRTIRQLLEKGDSYQVNLTQQLFADSDQDPEVIFASLFQNQPTEGSLFLQWDSHAVCSVSPELFFSLDGDSIRMQPMKGTRSRGANPEQDQRLYAELQDCEKERAENLMIVDMIRNDLSKIAVPGSVKAEELFQIVELPTVWQQVSTINASTTAGLADIFSALFPCASITGAPKIRTMEIIQSLEPGSRGIYTGALGMVRPNRQMQFQVAIRTLLMDTKHNHVSYGVGSGIVWDSQPEKEWEETMVKAKVATDSPNAFCLLETMRFIPSSGIARLTHHLHRMRKSAEYFGFEIQFSEIEQVLTNFSSKSERKLRLLLSRDGSYVLEDHDPGTAGEPMRLKMAVKPVNSSDCFVQHKTTNRQVYEAAKEDSADCDDVILWNERGELTETTVCNLYLELDGRLLTPDSHCGLLKGTYREELLLAGETSQAILTREDLMRATRLFVSNSVRGLCEATLISK
jgi:para-aminobenzoate synthetase / 4-amino-4-deoxychorismate lyase